MNTDSPETKRCLHCGASLEHLSVGGVCPRCMLSVSLATQTKITEGLTDATQGGSKEAAPLLAPEDIAPHFPQLEILEYLGRGGMGVVYKARQKTLNRLAALKILAPGKDKDPHFADRFAGEATALARLSHQNIVTIYDFGRTNGFFFLLMEYVDGANLRQVLRGRRLNETEALAIISPVCDALQYAHDQGIVHQDIKPENLLLDKQGRLKIADFGISRMIGGERTEAPAESKAMGTPQYMAPEQFKRNKDADQRTDVYSLGVLLYELLTGELPRPGFQSPSRIASVDPRLDGIVMQALNPDPHLRFQQASEVRTRIDTIARTATVRRTEETNGQKTGLWEKNDSARAKKAAMPNIARPFPIDRTAWLYLFYAMVTLIPVWLSLGGFREPGESKPPTFNWGTLAGLAGVAMLTGGRWWRLATLLMSGAGTLAIMVPLITRGAVRLPSGMPLYLAGEFPGAASTLVTVSGAFALITSLWLMLRPDIRMQLDARARLPSRWSREAISAAVLSAVALGFVPILPANGVAGRVANAFLSPNGPADESLQSQHAGLIMTISALSLICGLSGVILGLHALRSNRIAANGLKGMGAAVCAVLAWPVLAATANIIRFASTFRMQHSSNFAAPAAVPGAVVLSAILVMASISFVWGWGIRNRNTRGFHGFPAGSFRAAFIGGIVVTSAAYQMSQAAMVDRLILESTSESQIALKATAPGNRMRVTMPMRHVAVFEFFLRNGVENIPMTNLCAILVTPDDRPLSWVLSWEYPTGKVDDKDPPTWRVGARIGAFPYPLARNEVREFTDLHWRPIPMPRQPIMVSEGESLDIPILETDRSERSTTTTPTKAFVRVRFQAIPVASKYRLTGGFAYTSTNYPAWLSPPLTAKKED